MTKTIKAFELNEKVRRFTESGSLKRLQFVIQNTRQVKKNFTGFESFAFVYLWQNMKQNEFCLVFDYETNLLLGYISKNENGIPQRYKENEKLFFDDMYTKA